MNDLSIIRKKNAEAAADQIPQLRAAGKFVVATYSGLHFVGCNAHDTLAQAQAEVQAVATANIPGERTQLLEPTEAPVIARDEPASLESLAQASADKRAAKSKSTPKAAEPLAA